MSYVISQELAPDNIRVMPICPGWVDTDFNHQDLKMALYSKLLFEVAKNDRVLGRMATPEEVAPTAVFLA